jgi:hypothetical protein
MQFTPDLCDQQGWQKHAHADFGDLLRRRSIQKVELCGEYTVKDDEENGETCLYSTQKGREKSFGHFVQIGFLLEAKLITASVSQDVWDLYMNSIVA